MEELQDIINDLEELCAKTSRSLPEVSSDIYGIKDRLEKWSVDSKHAIVEKLDDLYGFPKEY